MDRKEKVPIKSDPGPSKPVPGLETGPTNFGHIGPDSRFTLHGFWGDEGESTKITNWRITNQP